MGSNRQPTDDKLSRVVATVAPVTLPPQAWGPRPLEWLNPTPAVWAWINWPGSVAERLPAVVLAMNDRVCVVEIQPDVFSRWQPVVWRNAVTQRTRERESGAGS